MGSADMPAQGKASQCCFVCAGNIPFRICYMNAFVKSAILVLDTDEKFVAFDYLVGKWHAAGRDIPGSVSDFCGVNQVSKAMSRNPEWICIGAFFCTDDLGCAFACSTLFIRN